VCPDGGTRDTRRDTNRNTNSAKKPVPKTAAATRRILSRTSSHARHGHRTRNTTSIPNLMITNSYRAHARHACLACKRGIIEDTADCSVEAMELATIAPYEMFSCLYNLGTFSTSLLGPGGVGCTQPFRFPLSHSHGCMQVHPHTRFR
jgi:hypothetical protein